MRNGKLNLLVLEDDKIILEVLRLSLGDLDLDVTFVENCEAARQAVSRVWPDLALIDIGLPDGNGYEFAKKNLSKSGKAPVAIIFLTGRKEKHVRLDTFQINTIDYITKPFSVMELTLKISNLKNLMSHTQNQPHLQISLQNSSNYLYQNLCDVCERNCDDANFGIADAAAELNLSVRTLQRRLRHECNKTFSQILTRTRIERARLLLDRNVEQKRISALCGYRYPENFLIAFKREMNMTPKEYRSGTMNGADQ